jgi:hypothetical protein
VGDPLWSRERSIHPDTECARREILTDLLLSFVVPGFLRVFYHHIVRRRDRTHRNVPEKYRTSNEPDTDALSIILTNFLSRGRFECPLY